MNSHRQLASAKALTLLTPLLCLHAAAQVGPTLTRPLADISRSLGDRAIFTAVAAGDNPLSYQWYFNGSPIANATNRSLTLKDLTVAQAGSYTVVISNAVNTLTSNAAILDVDTTFQFVTDTPITKDSGSGSMAWADYDGDGLMDLMCSGITSIFLYHNDGNGHFTKISQTNAVVAKSYSAGNIFPEWMDYDNDGRPDVYLVSGSNPTEEPDYLFHNLGDGRFEQIVNPMTRRGLASMSASWGDFNGDGRLDVFLANITSNFQAKPNELWYGQLDGSFKQASTEDFPGLSKQNYGSAVVDYDDDGDVDVVVGVLPGGAPVLYDNRGTGAFDVLQVSGGGGFIGAPTFADYDNDGLPDIFMGYARGVCRLYHNQGQGNFELISGQPLAEEPGRTPGGSWGDYDNDGWPDLFLPRETYHTTDGSNNDSLWHNNGDGTFTRVQAGSLGSDADNSWGAAWGDYNNDGFLDLVVPVDSANRLYRNAGNANSWLTLKLVGTTSNRDAIGARVRVRAAIGGADDRRRTQFRWVGFEAGWAGQNDPRVHFGLAEATQADEIEIRWPRGKVTTLKNVAARQFLTVIEPGGAPRLKLLTESTLQLTGDPDTNYIVERSSNLKDWEPLPEHFKADATGQVKISVAPDGAAIRFFRARQP